MQTLEQTPGFGELAEFPQPNADAIACWNDILVPKFTRFRHIFVGSANRHSDDALSRHPVATGERILDVGCGFGETTLQLAAMTGPQGEAIGQDCCEGFIEVGRRDAIASGILNAQFISGDAQTDQLGDGFDLCFSRFGTMFFANPVAALRNLRSTLRPEGRLMMLTWRDITDNPWVYEAKRAALRHLPAPEDGISCGPGPFSMASERLVRDLLSIAGFSNIHFERIDKLVSVGKDLDEAIDFQLSLGPAGEIVREAGELGEQKRASVQAELRQILEPHVSSQGVMLNSSSWCVTAQA